MRADRLLSILMLLQTRGRMTAHDLADRLEVSERTIYRDLEALSMAGIPVYAERGPGGGCSLLDGYQTRLTGLTEAEIQALFLATMAGPLADLGLSKALEDALLKISAALPTASRDQAEQMRQRVHLDTTWWYHHDDQALTLQTIQQALWQDRVLCLAYLEDDGAEGEYLVEPYGLVAKAHVWYLVGYNHERWRVFRLSRIQSSELTGTSFIRSCEFDLASYWYTYCTQSEAIHAPYAAPLRIAPDDAQMLVSSWYAAQSVNDVAAMNTEAQSMAFRRPQQKKRPSQEKKAANPAYPSYSATRHGKEKQLFLLNGTGEWQALSRSREEKKRTVSTKNEARQRFQARKRPMPLAPTKKTDLNGPLIGRSTKKTDFGRSLIKKRNSTAQGSAVNGPSRPNKKKAFRLMLFSTLPKTAA